MKGRHRAYDSIECRRIWSPDEKAELEADLEAVVLAEGAPESNINSGRVALGEETRDEQ